MLQLVISSSSPASWASTALNWPLQGEQAHALLEDQAMLDGQALRWAGMSEASLPEVMPIEQAAYPHPWSQRNLHDALTSGYLTQLLYAGDALVGYFVAMPGVDEVHLLNITVAPQWQGRGLGWRMLKALACWAQDQGMPQIWLEVRRSNERAIASYLRFGFTQVSIRKGYYPDTPTSREDAIVMSLNLPTSPSRSQEEVTP